MESNLLAVSEYLNQTLSPDDAIRRPAEQSLQALQREPGYSLWLLKLIQEPSLPPYTSQAAAIAFKNFVKTYWDPGEEPDAISPQDRQVPTHLTGVAAFGTRNRVGPLFRGENLIRDNLLNYYLMETWAP